MEDKAHEKQVQIETPETVTEDEPCAGSAESNAGQAKAESEGGSKKTATNSQPPETKEGSVDLGVILDIPLEITVELGRTKLPIHELLNLGPGSAVALSRLEGEPVDILANNTLIARGVVLVKNDRYGIRITEITSRLERLKSLS